MSKITINKAAAIEAVDALMANNTVSFKDKLITLNCWFDAALVRITAASKAGRDDVVQAGLVVRNVIQEKMSGLKKKDTTPIGGWWTRNKFDVEASFGTNIVTEFLKSNPEPDYEEETVNLPDVNWDHLKALSSRRQELYERICNRIEKITTVAQIKVAKEYLGNLANDAKLIKSGKRAKTIGLDYKRFALAYNTLLVQARKVCGSLPPTWKFLSLKNFEKTQAPEKVDAYDGLLNSFTDNIIDESDGTITFDEPFKPSRHYSPSARSFHTPAHEIEKWRLG